MMELQVHHAYMQAVYTYWNFAVVETLSDDSHGEKYCPIANCYLATVLE